MAGVTVYMSNGKFKCKCIALWDTVLRAVCSVVRCMHTQTNVMLKEKFTYNIMQKAHVYLCVLFRTCKSTGGVIRLDRFGVRSCSESNFSPPRL